jgi:DNA ligase-1
MSALEFQFHRGGIFLPRLNLWLDPHDPKVGPEQVFVSHAHSDHTGAHREVILSEATARFMQARIGGERLEHRLAFREPREFRQGDGRYRITLLPAGHIFGSAMSLIEAEGDSLLYTGDFKLRRGLSAEPCEPCHADTLIMETTYGQPKYEFPPTAEVMQGIVRFCQQAIDNDETPVLFGYSLGKSQEILSGLAGAGLAIMLHAQVHKLTKIYEQLGQAFPAYEKLDPATAQGKVLVCPPNANRSALLRQVGHLRTAVLTGWAIDPGCRYQSQCDAAFPLSDHADFPDLVEFVKRVAPRRVYTLHGFAADFAHTLRDLGFEAQALSESEQLSLRLDLAAARSGAVLLPSMDLESKASGEHASSFLRFAEISQSIGATSKKLEKTERLSAYLATLQGVELAAVTTWFTGLAFGPGSGKVLQLGWSIIRAAVCAIAGLPESRFRHVYLKHSDTGETVFEIFAQVTQPNPTWSLAEIALLFEQLHLARGPTAKTPLLAKTLKCCTALEAKYLVKILTGDLRIGLKEGLVEEAIARAFNVPLDAIKRVHLLLGDIGETALLAQTGQLQTAGLVPFRAVKCMLASPEETAVDVWKRVAAWHQAEEEKPAEPSGCPALRLAWIEDKYDGIRCQVHKVGPQVELFSRDLKKITATFPELVDALAKGKGDFILDGEILAMRDGRALPFAELQKRLGRRESDLFMHEEVPIRFIAFDLLWHDGETLLDLPLAARRKRLEALHLGAAAFQLAHIAEAANEPEIEAAFKGSRGRNNEGLIIKDPASAYSPGRRGLSWLKLKKALATLDCVIVGAEWGHGKRKEVLSDYTFAVRDDVTGELKTIGKAYSGLTDLEIAELTKHLLSRVIRQRGRYHEVTPDTVLEIAFDAIQESERHSSGLAMRFPRIARIRTDKTVADIDTVAGARKLVSGSG